MMLDLNGGTVVKFNLDLEVWNKSSRVLAGTGHRPDKLGDEWDGVGPFSSLVRDHLDIMFNELSPSRVISGMALGFDQLFAEEALSRGIPVTAAVPCDEQERVWPVKSQERYRRLLENSLVTVHNVSPGPYHASKMQVRNRWMCDNSDGLVGVWNGTRGGTANCLDYAFKKKMVIYCVNLKDIKFDRYGKLYRLKFKKVL